MTQDIDNGADPGFEDPDEIDGLTGETVEFVAGRVNAVHGEHVTVRQSLVSDITAKNVIVRQGAVRNVSAESVDMLQGAVAIARPTSALLRASSVAVCAAEGEVQVDQSAVGALIARGEATLDHSPAIAVVGRNVRVENSSTLFLFAHRVEGSLKTVFGAREALVFGVAAGAMLAAAHLIPRLFGRR